MAGPLDDILGPAKGAGPLDDILGPAEPDSSYVGAFLRGGRRGVTLETDEELIGLGSAALGGDYDESVSSSRKQKRADDKQYPITSGVGKAVGAIASFLPFMKPVQGVGAGARAYRAAQFATGGGNAARAIPGAAIPTGGSLISGTHAAQGGIAATKYGIGERLGSSGSSEADAGTMDHMLERGKKALDPVSAAQDYLLGRGGTWVGNRVGDAITGIGTARARAGVDSGTRQSIDAMREDRLTDLGPIRDAVFPQHRTLGNEGVERVLTAYGQAIGQGADEMTARRAAEQAVLTVNPNANARTVTNQVRSVVQQYNERNAIPMQLQELVALTSPSEGMNTRDLYQKGLNMKTGGQAAGEGYAWATDRQRDSAARVSELFAQRLGNGDVDTILANLVQRRDAANGGYSAVLASADQVPGLGQALRQRMQVVADEIEQEFAGRTDDLANAVRQQLAKFMGEETETIGGQLVPKMANRSRTIADEVTGQERRVQEQIPQTLRLPDGTELPQMQRLPEVSTTYQTPSADLNGWLGQRSALGDAIEDAKGDFGRGTSKSTLLGQLKERIDNQVFGLADDQAADAGVRDVIGQVRDVNAQRASAGALDRAYREGLSLNLMARKGKSLEALSRTITKVERMGDGANEMFFNGVMAQVKAALDTGGDLHNVAKIFQNNRMRDLMVRFLGREQADTLANHVQRVAIGTGTVNMRRTSPTAKLTDQGMMSKILSFLQSAGNPISWAHGAAKYGEEALHRRRYDEAMRVLSTNTDRPDQLIEALRQIGGVMNAPPPPNALLDAARRAPFAGIGAGTTDDPRGGG